jgi:hypothetical protein
MKIAYLLLTHKIGPGIEETLTHRAKAMKEILETADFFVISANNLKKNYGAIHYLTIPYRYKSFLYFFYLYFYKLKFVTSQLDLKDYDYVILRYNYADFSSIPFVRKNRVITEHHTSGRDELMHNILANKRIIEKILLMIQFGLDCLFFSRLIRNLYGVIGLTEEITHNIISRTKENISHTSIANGICTSEIKHTGFKPFESTQSTIHLVMLASKYRAWLGIERILRSIEQYIGKYRFRLHLIGDISINDLAYNNKKAEKMLVLHGKKTKEETDQLIGGFHLAVASMALFKLNMQEACPLKSREYSARGIPFIYAYQDMDLSDELPFFKQFSNNNEPIDMDEVISFIHDINGIPNISGNLRRYAKEKMDVKVKCNELIEFINK